MKFHLPDMTCGHCVAAIEKAVTSADASASVKVDLGTRMTEFSTTMSRDALMQVLAQAGYAATALPGDGPA